MLEQVRINLLLLTLNIIALGNYVFPPRNQSLVIFVLLITIKIPLSIKYKIKIIAILSLGASYFTLEPVCQLMCVIALGLTVNTAYQLDLSQGPSAINTALGISHVLSFWSKEYLLKNSLNRDITVIIFTLPNLFLSYDCFTAPSKKLYLINPFLYQRWQYATGFVIGIYTTSLTSIQKHVKFFIIAVILLIELNFNDFEHFDYIIAVLSFIRGLMVYTQKIHPIQKYFLYGYLIFTVFLNKYLISYLFIGYLIIGVILYQDYLYRKQMKKIKKDQSIETKEIQLELMNQMRNKRQF